MVKTITAQEFAQLCTEGPRTLIDVRTPAEFAEARVAFAQNVPLDQISPETAQAHRKSTDDTLYFVCKAGGRSRQACERLHAAGTSNIVNVDGGTSACLQAGLPAVQG